MVDSISVERYHIGISEPCFIIAEAGVNHNGDLDLAMRLIDQAKRVGADAVKFQTWVTEKLMVPDTPLADYQAINAEITSGNQFDMAKSLELTYAQFRELKSYADQVGILFFSTPDESDSSDFLETLPVPLFKIGSGEVTNLPFLHHVALKQKPIILSTGMSTLSEVESAVRIIEDAGNHQLVLLHCVSNYPADPAECNLRSMSTLRSAFQYPVGYSDHTTGTHVSIAAVAMGACVLEKHLTLSEELPGPDHSLSLNPDEFSSMVCSIRAVESAIGTGRKWPVESEMSTKGIVQKSIVAARFIPKGDRIDSDGLILLRAGIGFPPSALANIVGRITNRDVAVNEVITKDMLI